MTVEAHKHAEAASRDPSLVCECADPSCSAFLPISKGEYGDLVAIYRRPSQVPVFFVITEHAQPAEHVAAIVCGGRVCVEREGER